MKKLLSILMFISLITIFAIGSVTVYAAKGDVIYTVEGKTLTAKSNGNDQGGIRNADAGTISLGSGEGHAIWGYEPAMFKSEQREFTVVVKAKIVTKGEETTDNVLRIDPKIRTKSGAEPEDQGQYYNGEDLMALVPDADGFVMLYSLITPEMYEEEDEIKIENRIWFTHNFEWEIDIYALSIIDGNVIPDEPEPVETPTPATPTPTASTVPETSAPAATSTTSANTDNDSTNSTGLIIGIIAAVVVIGGGVAFFVIKKKK